MTDVSTLLLERVAAARLTEHVGHVVRQVGLLVEATGPACAGVGDLCHISLPGRILPAEVVGLDGVRLQLLPYGETGGLRAGSRVTACDRPLSVDLGPALLGRVVDAFCQPLDGKGDIAGGERRPIRRRPAGPLARRGIDTVLETRVRAIDTLLTLGYGQRMAIMAGSGVGKSTLLGMLSRHCVADVIVVALIGERGREVLEFVENRPGADGMRNVVMVVATFCISTLSVISSSSCDGSSPVSASVRVRRSTKSAWRKSMAETFTDMQMGGRPWACQARDWRQALRSTHWLRATISPQSSATGMNTAGLTRPWPGRAQRTRASAPTTAPLASSSLGW